MTSHRRQLVGILIGVAITPIAALAAVASAGAGHGSYVLAKLLFPFSFLLTRLSGDVLTYPLIGLALAQFPIYGWAAASGLRGRAILVLSITHALAAIVCFSGFLPGFG